MAKFAARIIETLENVLGIVIEHIDGGNKLHLKGLIERMLQMFEIIDFNPQTVAPPRHQFHLEQT